MLSTSALVGDPDLYRGFTYLQNLNPDLHKFYNTGDSDPQVKYLQKGRYLSRIWVMQVLTGTYKYLQVPMGQLRKQLQLSFILQYVYILSFRRHFQHIIILWPLALVFENGHDLISQHSTRQVTPRP